MIPDVNTNEITDTNANFTCGVVEGFYGRPWTSEQRRILFRRMEKMGLNTYLYAPKDDCKHRMVWREQYSVEEADHLTSLINAAHEHNVDFVYAISPGIDITYSNAKDVTLLKKKLEQVASFGCKSFALLFDDIEVEMCASDKEVFQSFAAAQVSVTNEVYQHLSQPKFLFCPTEYCASRSVPTVSQSEYLKTVGTKLLPAVDVLWTGAKVVSKTISIESIKELSEVLCRPPIIWDNIHANDYDRKRLFLGPYDGRSPALISHLRGVLTNPNCEFEGNFIAMHTLAQWATSGAAPIHEPLPSNSPLRAEIKLETECGSQSDQLPCDIDPRYSPRQALTIAVMDWYDEMLKESRVPTKRFLLKSSAISEPPIVPVCATMTTTTTTPMCVTNINELNNLEVNASYMQPSMSSVPLNSLEDSDLSDTESVPGSPDQEPMDMAFTPDTTPSSSVPDSPANTSLLSSSCVTADSVCDQSPVSSMSPSLCSLSREEVSFLVDCFYLPFEHGSRSVCMLEDLVWLRQNTHVVCESKGVTATPEQLESARQWQVKASELKGHVNAYWTMVERFATIPNQAVVLDLIPYIMDLKNILCIMSTFLDWMADGNVPYISVCAMNGYPYAWTHQQYKEAFTSGNHEPWVFQGGLQAEFQRLLPLDGVGDLLLPGPVPSVSVPMYNVRPYALTDEDAVYAVCHQCSCNGALSSLLTSEHRQLLPDKLIGAYLTLSPQYCFVIENTAGVVCGFVVAALDARIFYTQVEEAWIPSMCRKYPKPESTETLTPEQEIMTSFHNHEVYLSEAVRAQFPSLVCVGQTQHEDPSAIRRCLAAACAALRANGSHGMHLEIPAVDKEDLPQHYRKLGFFDINGLANPPTDTVNVFGRPI